ncbi:hypothetical protein GRAN_0621 [Granulicella sibirica]|uniref:DUF2848 domain-containing protein n=1 Tax=Granulicella sibirica TaxID=2479048 RepID=A0A4Q0T6U0_9BACT|nr:hypothetical protein GRAN_0621 [Granulicella sibirica]
MEHHIAELQVIGVARPRTVPCFYRVGADLLTTASEIEVTGPDSSGEAEFVLISLAEGLCVGLGSDHTDRKVEAYGVTVSKQMCPKPICRELWPFDSVKGHWDSLILRSSVTRAGETSLYQEGLVSRMLAPEDLISRYAEGAMVLPVDSAMYCGTMPLLAAMGSADTFTLELEDPVLGRSLKHSYTCRELPYND